MKFLSVKISGFNPLVRILSNNCLPSLSTAIQSHLVEPLSTIKIISFEINKIHGII